jgi:DNA-binding PadR family transcriptional regulator
MLKGKVFTDLYEVAVFLYLHQGKCYAKGISKHTGVKHASVYPVLRYLREEGLVHWEEERLAGKSYRAPRIYVELNQLGRVWVKEKVLEKAKGLIPLIEQEFQRG